MDTKKTVFYELILLFSGVLVFRSLWTLMDAVPFLNEPTTHTYLLILGLILSFFAIHGLSNKC